MDSVELVEMLKRNDKKAISSLYDEYAPSLYGIILRILKSHKRSELILESTILNILKDIHSYKQHTSFFTWMVRIARTTAAQSVVSKDLTDQGNMEQHQTAEICCPELILGMESKCKEVLSHVYFQGHSLDETAQSLGMPLQEVKKCLKLALAHVRTKISFTSLVASVLICIL